VLEGLDLAGLYETAELGARNPLLLVAVGAPATAAAPAHDKMSLLLSQRLPSTEKEKCSPLFQDKKKIIRL
jgi:hypothetical protein